MYTMDKCKIKVIRTKYFCSYFKKTNLASFILFFFFKVKPRVISNTDLRTRACTLKLDQFLLAASSSRHTSPHSLVDIITKESKLLLYRTCFPKAWHSEPTQLKPQLYQMDFNRSRKVKGYRNTPNLFWMLLSEELDVSLVTWVTKVHISWI